MTADGGAAQVADVYRERDEAVAALAQACRALGMPVGMGWDPDAAKDDAAFGPVLFITLPTGQVSWHVRNDELVMFGGLVPRQSPVQWDGHDHAEKRRRLIEYAMVRVGRCQRCGRG